MGDSGCGRLHRSLDLHDCFLSKGQFLLPITPSQALQELQTQTSSFLGRYPVRIFGDPSGSQVSSYRIEDGGASQRPGTVLRTHSMQATQMFQVRARGSAFGNPAGSVWFNAHSVKMFDSNQLANIGTYTLPVAGGPDLMLTGQLSGCAFAIQDNGDGSLVVAHIQPGQHVDAVTLQRTLQNTPGWTTVYGREDYGQDRVASIVGGRVNGRWRIWVQKQDRTSGDYQIRSVKQLV
jgi:hypothetical protein